jgi:hypothetical protein
MEQDPNIMSIDILERCIKFKHATLIQKIWRGYITRLKKVINIIETNINDYNKLIKFYGIFGESLNSNDMKSMKGKCYEIFYTHKSKLFKHVDKVGYDITCLGIKIEHKFGQGMLLTEGGRELKKNITFRCKNSNGSGEMELNRSNTAHLYVLTQRDAIAYVHSNHVLNNLKGKGDLNAIIPKEHVKLLWKNDVNINIKNGEFNLSNLINDIFHCISKSIWENNDWKKELKICLYNIADNL